MRSRFAWSKIAVLAAGLALPIKVAGCGNDTACFTFSQAAYDKAGGACPASDPALKRFSDSACGSSGPITAVNGEGSFDGEFCCYPVTQTGETIIGGCIGGFGGSSGFSGAGGGGVGGSGGIIEGGSAMGGFGTTSTGTGGAGGAPTCFSCNDELDGTSMDPGQLCAVAAMYWSGLNTCNCGAGPCTVFCSDTACTGLTPSDACKTCMTDTSMSGCGAQLAACMAN